MQKIYITLLGLCLVLGMQAQEVCTIRGTVDNDSLRFSPQRVEKVYLSRLDEYDRIIPVDSAKLTKGSFTFRRTLAKEEPVLLYFITGFDNGQVPVFVEPGEVSIHIRKAAFPGGGKVKGTVTNDLYAEYKTISDRCFAVQDDSLAVLLKQHGEEWMNTPEGQNYFQRIGAAAVVNCNAERIRFLIDHNDSPLAPLMMEREIYYMLDKNYAEELVQTVSPTLMKHPYYRSFSNTVRALDLKVGGELPDITLPLADGGKAQLSDYKGKFVLLDFWASWCAPCLREMPFMKQVYEAAADKRDQFVIISFSIDNKEKPWRDAIQKQDIAKEGWIHASDLLGWGSPAARMMGVDAVPKTILINPEGRAISFSLRGEEMVARVKQILSGDLYYEGDSKENK